jgi:hypothetical protein
MRLIFACVVVLLIFSYVKLLFKLLREEQAENLREEQEEILEYYREKFERKFQPKLDVMCCFYRQHYHDCFSAINYSGCVIGSA